MKGKFAYLLMGLLGSVGLATAFALPAGATAHAAPNGVNVDSHYSTTLVGHALEGDGSEVFKAVWGGATVGNPGSAVPGDTLAVGVALAESEVNASPTYGLGLVWDDTKNANTCGTNSWVLESGEDTSPVTPGAPEPVPVGDLSPLLFFGADVCIAPGGTQWLQIHQTRSGELQFITGPSESDNNLLASVHAFGEFHGAGEGATTTVSDAANINLGQLVSFNTFAVTRINRGGIRSADTQNLAVGSPRNNLAYATYTGTEDGGPPTVSNLITLTPSSLGDIVDYGSVNTITVP